MDEGKDQTLAIISLITALVGFVMMPFSMSILAIITGRIQLNKIKEDPLNYGGETLALVGFWIGVIRGVTFLIIGVLSIIFILLIFGLPFIFILGS